MKTLQQCKDEVAVKYGFENFEAVPLMTGVNGVHITDMLDEAAELYAQSFASLPKWIDVRERLPEIDVPVLCYYTIKKSGKLSESEDKFHHCLSIGRVASITTRKESKSVEWVDRDYNSLEPLSWQPLPELPNNKKGKE